MNRCGGEVSPPAPLLDGSFVGWVIGSTGGALLYPWLQAFAPLGRGKTLCTNEMDQSEQSAGFPQVEEGEAVWVLGISGLDEGVVVVCGEEVAADWQEGVVAIGCADEAECTL